MSFAAETKRELAVIIDESRECRVAELSALIRMNGTINLSNQQVILEVQTENAAIARKIFTLIKDVFEVSAEIMVRKKMRLRKNNIYVVRLLNEVEQVLRDLRIVESGFVFSPRIDPTLIKETLCKRAYLRGAFLAGGSINNPDSGSYHLEISASYQEHAEDLTKLANYFKLNAKWNERKKGYFIYLKEGEKISDFLSVVGAHQALLKFEDVRIVRDIRNSVNRIVNCEKANLKKISDTGVRQSENIRLIDREIGLRNLPVRLQEIAELRLQYPESSLQELGELVPSGKISKSGVNHRLRKLDEIAGKLRGDVDDDQTAGNV